MSIFSLFYFQYHSFPSAAAILIGFTKKVVRQAKVHRDMSGSKTNRWQCSCPFKRHENDIH